MMMSSPEDLDFLVIERTEHRNVQMCRNIELLNGQFQNRLLELSC